MGTPDGRAGDEVDEVILTVPAYGSDLARDEWVQDKRQQLVLGVHASSSSTSIS